MHVNFGRFFADLKSLKKSPLAKKSLNLRPLLFFAEKFGSFSSK
jgi:hypothetical protein